MKKFKKLCAKIFIILATFFVVLSPIVLVEEAGHTCNHEDCQICEVIRTAEENIKHTIKFSSGAAVALLIAVSLPLLLVSLLSLQIVIYILQLH